MKHLWDLPAWLDLPEAAEYLRDVNTDPVISAVTTLLDAALEGAGPAISVHFPSPSA